jgi:hypothetical protein
VGLSLAVPFYKKCSRSFFINLLQDFQTAGISNREMASSLTGELLISVLTILKNIHKYDSCEAHDLPKGHTTSFRAFVPRFRAAVFLVQERLVELEKADAVDLAVVALHKTARCLDTIAGPTGGSLQSVHLILTFSRYD